MRSHACENDQYGKPGGCSDICLLANSHKARTCRCRSGFSLGSDGKSCKSEYEGELGLLGVEMGQQMFPCNPLPLPRCREAKSRKESISKSSNAPSTLGV